MPFIFGEKKSKCLTASLNSGAVYSSMLLQSQPSSPGTYTSAVSTYVQPDTEGGIETSIVEAATAQERDTDDGFLSAVATTTYVRYRRMETESQLAAKSTCSREVRKEKKRGKYAELSDRKGQRERGESAP